MRHKDWGKMDRIIDFVNAFHRENRRSPSVRELAAGVGMGRSAAHNYLRAMCERGLIDYDGKTIVTERLNKVMDDVSTIGIIGNIPCGPLSLEEESVEEVVYLPASIFGKGDLFLLHARGDSMTGAGIDDGDLVLIRRQEEANDGDIVAAWVDGEGSTLKRWRVRDGRAFLHPENPAFRDIPAKNCRIQGIAVRVIKNLE